MITNEKQYALTREQAEKFRAAIAREQQASMATTPYIQQLLLNSLKGQLESLEQDLHAWENAQHETYRVTITATLRYTIDVGGTTREDCEQEVARIYDRTDFADYDVVGHEETWDVV